MEEEIREVEPVVKVEEPKRASTNKIVIIAVVGVVVVLVMLFVPFIPVEETYTITEDYETTASYSVERSDAELRFGIPAGFYYDVYVKVRNTDVKGGTFDVSFHMDDITRTVCSKTKSNYIGPGDTHQFHFYCDVEAGRDYTWDKTVYPPTIIDTHMVEKERTVYKSVYQILTGG